MQQSQLNPYPGVNPYLMSLLQTPGTLDSPSSFPSFHADHITHIKDFLNDILPPHYIALTEPSIQIQALDPLHGRTWHDSQPSPDVAIYQTQQTGPNSAPAAIASPTLQLALSLEEQRELKGIAIYPLQSVRHQLHGEPLVRLELLLPANMSGGSYAYAYAQSRLKSLLAGSTLVEIDYLHEYTSPVPNLPHYPDHPAAQAYVITLSHPVKATLDVYFFGLQDPIPTIPIPLAGSEIVNVNFNEPYQFTWAKSRFWAYLDYTDLPLRFASYRPADQAVIQAHRQTIQ